jgi:hypothetical protein
MYYIPIIRNLTYANSTTRARENENVNSEGDSAPRYSVKFNRRKYEVNGEISVLHFSFFC